MALTGPVTGGSRGWPFSAATFDLEALGYVEEEWFLDGEATVFRHAPGTGRSWDGRWVAEPDGTLPFRTRLLVRRPVDPAAFNGTVALMWNNVSHGFDLFAGESPELYDGGFAFVGVSVQRKGVHGYEGGASPGLTRWDPERYNSLSLPTDDVSYDIYTQTARAVGPQRELGPSDPLGGLAVQRVLGLGASQSAVWLATYLNAVQPLTGALDGLILDIYFGNGSALRSDPAATDLARPQDIAAAVLQMRPGSHLLRDDTGIPVFVLNSESEATKYHPVRQPDTDAFRFWEVAGVAHSSRVRGSARLPSNWPRDLGTDDSPMGTPADANVLQLEPVRSAVLRHVQRWMVDGVPPPVQPRIEFDVVDGEPVIRRDELGLAIGGVRVPDVAVPTARHSGLAVDGSLALAGSSIPFDDATIRRVYPDDETYVRQREQAVAAAVDAGVLRPEDAQALPPPSSIATTAAGGRA
jgi:hypothetical protein